MYIAALIGDVYTAVELHDALFSMPRRIVKYTYNEEDGNRVLIISKFALTKWDARNCEIKYIFVFK